MDAILTLISATTTIVSSVSTYRGMTKQYDTLNAPCYVHEVIGILNK